MSALRAIGVPAELPLAMNDSWKTKNTCKQSCNVKQSCERLKSKRIPGNPTVGTERPREYRNQLENY